MRVLLFVLLMLGLAGCSLEEGARARECDDAVDNDSDGAIDCEDDGCCGTWICGVRCGGTGDDDDSSGG